jgi:hypothetical protein
MNRRVFDTMTIKQRNRLLKRVGRQRKRQDDRQMASFMKIPLWKYKLRELLRKLR